MEDHTTSRRSRRTVFKGPIRGFIHHARGRGEVIAYSEVIDTRSASPARLVGNESDTPFHDVERFSGGELQPRGSINDNTDNTLREQAHRPPSQGSDIAESRAIVEDLPRRAAVAEPARPVNHVETSSAIKPENQENLGSDERIPGSGNGRVLNYSQLEREFLGLSPDMQRYLIWLQRTTESEYVFTHQDQTVPPPTNDYEDLSQR